MVNFFKMILAFVFMAAFLIFVCCAEALSGFQILVGIIALGIIGGLCVKVNALGAFDGFISEE